MIENFSESHHRPTIRDEGIIYSATGSGKIPFVSCDDIAAVTYRALVDEKSHNCDHVLYGRELLTYGDVSCSSSSLPITLSLFSSHELWLTAEKLASTLTDVLGKPITHAHLTESELAERYARFGVPEGYAKVLAEKDTNIKNGEEEHLNDTVEEVTGQSPKTFREFAEEKKEVWQ